LKDGADGRLRVSQPQRSLSRLDAARPYSSYNFADEVYFMMLNKNSERLISYTNAVTITEKLLVEDKSYATKYF
jgi:hypothetical protein